MYGSRKNVVHSYNKKTCIDQLSVETISYWGNRKELFWMKFKFVFLHELWWGNNKIHWPCSQTWTWTWTWKSTGPGSTLTVHSEWWLNVRRKNVFVLCLFVFVCNIIITTWVREDLVTSSRTPVVIYLLVKMWVFGEVIALCFTKHPKEAG